MALKEWMAGKAERAGRPERLVVEHYQLEIPFSEMLGTGQSPESFELYWGGLVFLHFFNFID